MKKKITAIFLCVALVAIAIVGASLAYFTDSKTAENTFTMGNVAITLDETDVTNPTGDRVTSNDYLNVRPGVPVTKDPIVRNAEGSNDAWIRAKVEVKGWVDTCQLATGYTTGMDMKATLNLLIDALGEGWSVVDADVNGKDVTFVLMYANKLAPKDSTTAMFNEVTVPAGIEKGGSFGPINITAQAIQADGLADWTTAFNAFDAK